MLTALWNFFKRHKKKVIFSGILFGGGVYLYKYAQRKFKEIQDKEASECLAHARRQHHFDSNQRTCNTTIISMLPSLRDIMMKKFDTEGLTEQLQSSPANKLEIWEQLKIYSFTRIICILYGCSLISLMLRVQLNILGGYMFLESMVQKNGTSKEVVKVSKTIQERYLGLIKHFMDTGLTDLVEVIQTAVEREIKSIPLKEKLCVHNIQEITKQIRERIESSPEISDLQSPTLMFCSYLIPTEVSSDKKMMSPEEELYNRLVRETRDILDSPDFHSVLKTSLDRSYSKLLDCIADHYRQTDANQNLHQVALPLAKLVPVISGLLYQLCSESSNPLIQELLILDQTKNLAANIYEAFSQTEEDVTEQT